MLAVELCSCHAGKTHNAIAFGVFDEETVIDGPDATKSDGDEQPIIITIEVQVMAIRLKPRRDTQALICLSPLGKS
ncbi:hypothetical protein PS876_04082 [Pseudomonas fluorescens]|nr:hypothetical protein PS876_04082 [Pseudomonas fluorescens]